MADKPYSRWEWRSKPCPECNGRGGWGEGDDFEICWNCDDGQISWEEKIEMTADEWFDYHRHLADNRYLHARYGAGYQYRYSIADYWVKGTSDG